MSEFKSYPTRESEPKRMTRKRARKEIFWYNKTLKTRLSREKRDAKKKEK